MSTNNKETQNNELVIRCREYRKTGCKWTGKVRNCYSFSLNEHEYWDPRNFAVLHYKFARPHTCEPIDPDSDDKYTPVFPDMPLNRGPQFPIQPSNTKNWS